MLTIFSQSLSPCPAALAWWEEVGGGGGGPWNMLGLKMKRLKQNQLGSCHILPFSLLLVYYQPLLWHNSAFLRSSGDDCELGQSVIGEWWSMEVKHRFIMYLSHFGVFASNTIASVLGQTKIT